VVHGDLTAYNVLLSSKGPSASAAGRGFVAKVGLAGGAGSGGWRGEMGGGMWLCLRPWQLGYGPGSWRRAYNLFGVGGASARVLRPHQPPTPCLPGPSALQVADFGFSHHLSATAVLKVNSYGTVTHMAPELLLVGARCCALPPPCAALGVQHLQCSKSCSSSWRWRPPAPPFAPRHQLPLRAHRPRRPA
jgi:serine/threonine protein kinase